ncbi:MAG TPA: glycine/betaine/sarcosine/D-proline family reductase selenoprotein B [Firmicutes bacterium]|nr:glycine/betaine/sarcosine/D-proline family reductase selenoprotein B [Bacillota bacterium]
MNAVRVVHYINQFFGGIGGEDKASWPVTPVEGAVGPGLEVEKALGEAGRVVGTVICGDNYFAENKEAAIQEILGIVAGRKPAVLIAGPAFNAGRYGAACAEVCAAVQERLGVPAVTAMYPENPGVRLHQQDVYVIPSGPTAASMREVLPVLVRFALKLARRETIGSALDEGYLPRGYRLNELHTVPAARRAVAMLHLKLAGKPFQTEIPLEKFSGVAPAPPVADLRHACLALVTEAGFVPAGNPDRLRHVMCDRWAKYSLTELGDFRLGEYEVVHGGYDARYILENPYRMLPLDVLRELEGKREMGKIHDDYLVTVGNGNPVSNAERIGREMGAELLKAGVSCAILPST